MKFEHSDYAMKCQKLKKANHLGGLARHKLPLGSTQPPATQVTHARRGSAQFRSFTIFLSSQTPADACQDDHRTADLDTYSRTTRPGVRAIASEP